MKIDCLITVKLSVHVPEVFLSDVITDCRQGLFGLQTDTLSRYSLLEFMVIGYRKYVC
jgi:hypothetical protein